MRTIPKGRDKEKYKQENRAHIILAFIFSKDHIVTNFMYTTPSNLFAFYPFHFRTSVLKIYQNIPILWKWTNLKNIIEISRPCF